MDVRLPSSSLVQVGGKQERFFWRVPVPGDDRDRVEARVDPGNEAQAPIGGVQADDARAELVETHGPFQQRACEGGIMDVGGRKQKADR